MGPSREVDLQWLERSRRRRKRSGSLAALALVEGDVALQRLGPRTSQFVQRVDLDIGQETHRPIERARFALSVRRCEQATSAFRPVRCQRSRALEEGRDSGQSSAPPSPSCKPLELGCDLLGGLDCGQPKVPCLPIRFELRVGGASQRSMGRLALRDRGRTVSG